MRVNNNKQLPLNNNVGQEKQISNFIKIVKTIKQHKIIINICNEKFMLYK